MRWRHDRQSLAIVMAAMVFCGCGKRGTAAGIESNALMNARWKTAALIGLVYYLRPMEDPRDDEEHADDLWREALDQYNRLESEWIQYTKVTRQQFEQMADNKAAAVCVDEPDLTGWMSFYSVGFQAHVSAWGFAADMATQEKATERALFQCQEAKKKYGHPGCVCRIVSDSFHRLTEPPQHWPAIIARIRNEMNREREANFSNSVIRPTLDAALDATTTKNNGLSPDSSIRLRAPKPVGLGYPDADRDYASVCHGRISYALFKPDSVKASEAKLQLSSVDMGKLYGCYDIPVDTIIPAIPLKIPKGMPVEHQCRYLATIKGQDILNVVLPINLKKAINTNDLTEIVVESVVRVDEMGRPLAKLPVARPVALRFGTNMLLAVEIVAPEPDGRCYVGAPFSGKLFDFSACKNAVKCRHDAGKAIIEAISSALSKKPFGAMRLSSEQLPPGEFRLHRQDQPSLVLGGAYYEKTIYTINVWSASSEDPFGSLYGRSGFRGENASDPRFFFLRLEHIYTVSKNRLGTFREPEDSEIRSYENELIEVVPRALREVCSELNSRIVDGVCLLSQRE